MTRGLRGVWLRRRLLDPRRTGFYSVQIFTHKVLRRVMVIPLVVLFLSAAFGARRSRVLATAVVGQSIFYSLGLAGLYRSGERKTSLLLDLPSYFVMVNCASAVAILNLLRGKRIEHWTPTSSAVGNFDARFRTDPS